MNPQSYVLVTPVRDEAKLIGQTIESVLAQTQLPAEWVIVSDGSTDGTNEIVSRYAARHPWIRLLALPPRTGRNFAAVVHNTEKGIRHLVSDDYGFVGLLDADVTFQEDYFEQILSRFHANPRLGLAGGVVIDIGLPRDRFPRNRRDVPGAVQFFRRSCFERIGGLMPIPEGGWDAMTCVMARMNGFQTQLFTDLVVDHHKPRNIAEGGIFRRKWQMGVRDYALGYHPLFELVKCLGKLRERPAVLAAIAWWIGFCTAAIQRRPRSIPPAVVRHVHQEQWSRLKGILAPNPKKDWPEEEPALAAAGER